MKVIKSYMKTIKKNNKVSKRDCWKHLHFNATPAVLTISCIKMLRFLLSVCEDNLTLTALDIS